ncbi:MAG: carbohydrate ABC transporter permease [Clostridia bacterium]|nr:carbohydrate ABC transporter permease [Clostridia bacterium]
MAKVKFKTPKENRVRKSLTPYVVIVGVILFIYALSLTVPLLWGFMTSFKSMKDWDRVGSLLNFPDFSTWESYKIFNQKQMEVYGIPYAETSFAYYDNVFGNYTKFFMVSNINQLIQYYHGWNMDKLQSFYINQGFFDFFGNTILYAGVSAVLTLLAPLVMGYLCAKFPNKFAGFIYSFVIVVMTLPIVGTGAAVLTLMKRISLHDTFWGLWIRECSFMNMYFLVFFAFFKSLPNTYSEAAEIDGAGYFRIMWTIYIPFAIKMVTTAFVIQFVSKYNNYTINLIHLPSRITLAYAAWKLSQDSAYSYPEKLAACFTLSVPMLIFFVVFRNKLMGNMTVGGLKG